MRFEKNRQQLLIQCAFIAAIIFVMSYLLMTWFYRSSVNDCGGDNNVTVITTGIPISTSTSGTGKSLLPKATEGVDNTSPCRREVHCVMGEPCRVFWSKSG
jgi:hypothetical protein